MKRNNAAREREAEETRALLADFGADLAALTPGVAFDVRNDNYPASAPLGFVRVDIGAAAWRWLRPLLLELRDRRP